MLIVDGRLIFVGIINSFLSLPSPYHYLAQAHAPSILTQANDKYILAFSQFLDPVPVQFGTPLHCNLRQVERSLSLSDGHKQSFL